MVQISRGPAPGSDAGIPHPVIFHLDADLPCLQDPVIGPAGSAAIFRYCVVTRLVFALRRPSGVVGKNAAAESWA